MGVLEKIHAGLRNDFSSLTEDDITEVKKQFTDECLGRIKWVTMVALFGELILLFLDLSSGFFSEHPLNYLNLFAELLIICSSLVVFLRGKWFENNKPDAYRAKSRMLGIYKMCLVVAVGCFIFTDIYVRQVPLGAYIVFVFVFQIVPFFGAAKNFILFILYMVFIAGTYLLFVEETHGNILFSIICIFIAFTMSTECLRAFFIKKIVNNHRNQLMTARFEKLAGQTIIALSDAVEAKDLYTKGHSQRVAKYSKEIARRMGYDEQKQNEVFYIGLLHDIGKIGVPDTVINKKGYLEEDEYAEIKKHPSMGYDILKNITEISDIGLGALLHHERYDGSGYPSGLAGNDIPPIARIIAVADAYDAMTSNRSYRQGLPQHVVREEILKNIGKQFDPETARIMLQMIDEDTEYRLREQGDVAFVSTSN